MSAKRMRVFAGPNGSGKTTIFKALLVDKQVELGVYVNADDIELELSQSKSLPFGSYQLNLNEKLVHDFFKASTFSLIKRNEPDLWNKLKVENNILHVDTQIDSYLAADLAELLRQQLSIRGISFTYETVMSHESKIDFLMQAKKNGYRVYLYYIATEDPEINSNRVNVRVAQKGHAVDSKIIKDRYYRSLQNLKPAVKNTSRAYIFDNSGEQAKLIAEITDGTDVLMNEAVGIPNWVAEHLLK
jgi:predicted ABC-type ATPase